MNEINISNIIAGRILSNGNIYGTLILWTWH